LPIPAEAQSGSQAVLGAPNTEAFPRIEAYLTLRDANGYYIDNIPAEQVQVLEDGALLPVEEMSGLRPGVQFVVAMNPGPSFGVRNSKGISRYDYVKEALRNWANSRQGSTLDDWSLLITNGPAASHVTDPSQWLAALDTDTVDARTAAPSLDTLVRAVGLASDPAIRPGMGRAVLFITPPPEGDTALALENISIQAKQQGISIFIWMVTSPGAFNAQAVEGLTALANQTGGNLFTYTGEEPLPNPEDTLEPLRHIYRLVYQSRITTSGAHHMGVQVQYGVERIESNQQSFEVNIQPPQPAFVSPPISIQRQLEGGGEAQKSSQETAADLTPKEQALQVIFDFPDGRMRPIVQASLLVDGVVVAQNMNPPFDQFVWKLEDYKEDGTHRVQVQVQDAFGLTGMSIEIPVTITVERPESDAWATVRDNIPLISGLAVLLAGAILVLVLVVGGRLHPSSLVAARSRRRRSDPVTQPIQPRVEPSANRLTGWVNLFQWPQRHTAPKAFAFLYYIPETEDQSTTPPIPITSDDVSLGSDSSLSTLVMKDPSVEALHARLTRLEDGSFRLADQGSIAGTWVNYTPISGEGVTLEHGDLIHIGRMGFRFTMRQPAQVRKPVVSLQNPEDAAEEPQP
jgi:hypothetical protein